MAGRGQGERTAGAGGFGGGLAYGLSSGPGGDLLGGGTGAARGCQAYLGPRALCRARRQDDRLGVLPPCGGTRPLSLFRPSAWPRAAGPGAADSGLAGAGRGYAPSGEFGSGSPASPAAPGWPP